MADLSQAEKRAAGWRKLKKFQQHKSSASSGKTARKKSDVQGSKKDDNSNQETFRYFTGFSDDHDNGVDNCSNASSTVQCIDSPDVSSSEDLNFTKQLPDKISEKDLSERLPAATDNPEQINTSAMQEAIPNATNIFSQSLSFGATNYSDFFDTIKPPGSNESTKVPNIESVTGPIDAPLFTHFKTEPSELKQEVTSLFSGGHYDGSPQSTTKSKEPLVQEENISDVNVMKPKIENTPCESENVAYGSTEASVAQDSPHIFLSSTESLRQLSLEVNGLIGNTESVPGLPSSELERRNQELAALLAREQQRSEQFQLQFKEYQSRASQLQVELAQQQVEAQARAQREVSALQEQLQVHVQTVGILVGEKTELEATLSKSQHTAKQKAGEVEELQGRLKASRHRVSELERELQSLSQGSRQLESSQQQQAQEAARMALERKELESRLEEVEEEAAELRLNVSMRSTETQKLQQELRERQSQLDLAQLRVQQLSSADSPDVEGQLESLHQQKVGLERQVAELQQTVRALSSERDQANTQYQEYLQHVNNQMKSMSEKMAATTAENEQLLNREQSLVKHLSELERQLQQQQQQQQRSRTKDSPSHTADNERIQQLEKSIYDLMEEKNVLTGQLETKVQEIQNSQDQLQESMAKMEELETLVETLKADQPDTHKLLAAMESDKVAAARAVGQNQKLKAQLEELQEGFIQMSNSKLELTEQLQKEQHVSRELGERLAQQELEISELRTHLEENEKLLEKLQKDSSEQLSRHIFQQDQIADQMRHYEAQGHLTDTLQKELHQTKVHCESLRSQNDELRMQLAQASVSAESTAPVERESSQRDDMVESLSVSVRQLEMERDELLHQLKERDSLAGTDDPDDSPSDQDVDKGEYVNMKHAMEKLEERFTQTMQEVAELSDEKQRLEHLVLQLQGETETIGEYIALYQMQRSILRQRAQEKDEQLARLARDREEVKMKLNELNRLIGELVTPSMTVSSADIKGHETTPRSEGFINGDVNMKDGDSENEQQSEVRKGSEGTKADTAGKIIALLSEIETSTLVEPRNMENFHPCPWCSGRLITV